MSFEVLSEDSVLQLTPDALRSNPPAEPTMHGQRQGPVDRSNVFQNWLETTNRTEMLLVVAGHSGAGKSTLISNMLRLSDKDDTAAPKSLHSPSSFDKGVKTYSSTRGDVTVNIVDTPGLAQNDVNHYKAIAELQERTGGRCDALLYCVSLLPDSKLGKTDENVIKTLTHVFGEEMWKQTILVFTFANLVKTLYPDQSIEALVKEYAQKFQSVLRRVCPSFSVTSVYLCDHQQHERRPPFTIVALPAGRNPDERFVGGLSMGWDESVFLEVQKKSSAHSMPVALRSGYLTMPRFARHTYLFGRFIVGSGILMTISVGTCYYFGKAIGLFVERFLIKGCDFVYSFPELGMMAGFLVFGPMCGFDVLGDVLEYEEAEVEFERIQDEIDKTAENRSIYHD